MKYIIDFQITQLGRVGVEDSADFADKTMKRVVIGEPPKFDNSLIDTTLRKEELRLISNAMISLRDEGRADNLFVYGVSGSGKTALMKNLLSAYGKKGRVVPVLLNCNEYRSKMAVFSKLAFELGNPISRRGFSFYELYEHIKELQKKENKTVLLALDDFDSLQASESSELLSPLIESNEVVIMVILIADHFKAFEKLDARIKSALMFRVVNIEPYTKDELSIILKMAAKFMLSPEAADSDIIEKIATVSETAEGNARFAIWLLRSAGKNAEERKAGKIGLDDVARAYESVLPIGIEKFSGLSSEEILIIELLKFGQRSSMEIYGIASKKLGRSKRQIRNYLDSLIDKGLIESETILDSNSIIKPRMFRLRRSENGIRCTESGQRILQEG